MAVRATAGSVSERRRLLLALELVTEPTPLEASFEALPQPLVTDAAFQAEAATLATRTQQWSTTDGIQGLGIGAKITAGQETEEMALRIYVDEKRAATRLDSPVPAEVHLPELGTVVTDVIESGVIVPEMFRERVRPVMPGCGLGHPDVTVGTLGAAVTRRGKHGFAISNSHVLADSGQGKKGDAILQSGTADGGKGPKDRVGKLADFVPFTFGSTGFPNLVDAAVAQLDVDLDPSIRLLGHKPKGITTNVRRGMRVQKVGRTTDLTTGIVQDVDFRLPLTYPGGRAGFRDQVACTRFTDGGDSGSLVLTSTGRAVGLHFAGSPSLSVFNRITHVLDLLEVDLVLED